MIKFDKVKKVYGNDIVALDDVTFTVEPGEFSFIVGPSGAGKSTLIRLLVRQELPTEGKIIFEDFDVNEIPNDLLSIYRRQLGIVFQDLKLINGKTVKENLEFALEISNKSKGEIAETVDYLLKIVGLEKRSGLFPTELSGGEKQRIAIARALANSPKVFIADEPTGNLDRHTADEILEILKTINKTGTTVLVITHDDNIVENMKTRVIEMKDGRIIKDGGKKILHKNKKADIFDGLDEKIVKKLKANKIDTLEEMLNRTEADFEKYGINDEEIIIINNHLQNYLSTNK